MYVDVYECVNSTMLIVPAGTNQADLNKILKTTGLKINPNGVRFSKEITPQKDPNAKSPFGITSDEAITAITANGYALSSSNQTFEELTEQPKN